MNTMTVIKIKDNFTRLYKYGLFEAASMQFFHIV